MIYYWNADPILLSFGPLTIRWYGLFFAGGFLAGLRVMQGIFRQEKISPKLLDPLLVHIMLGTVIGARLGHCLFYEPAYYLSHPIQILFVWEGGLASHGGGLGVLFALWLFAKKHPATPYLWLLDRVAILTALAGGMIRMGNFLNSEIIGKPTDGSWGVVFVPIDNLPRHPSQLYESFFYLSLACLLWALWKKGLAQAPGRLVGLFLLATFTFRFFIEFIKENQTLAEQDLALNIGQILSLPLILLGIFFILRSRRAA